MTEVRIPALNLKGWINFLGFFAFQSLPEYLDLWHHLPSLNSCVQHICKPERFFLYNFYCEFRNYSWTCRTFLKGDMVLWSWQTQMDPCSQDAEKGPCGEGLNWGSSIVVLLENMKLVTWNNWRGVQGPSTQNICKVCGKMRFPLTTSVMKILLNLTAISSDPSPISGAVKIGVIWIYSEKVHTQNYWHWKKINGILDSLQLIEVVSNTLL